MSLVLRNEGAAEDIEAEAWEPCAVPLGSHVVMSHHGRQTFDFIAQEPVKLYHLQALYRAHEATQKLGLLPLLVVLTVGRLRVQLHAGEYDGTSRLFEPVSLAAFAVDAKEEASPSLHLQTLDEGAVWRATGTAEEVAKLLAIAKEHDAAAVELCSVLGCGQPSTNDKTAPWGYCAAHTPAGDQ